MHKEVKTGPKVHRKKVETKGKTLTEQDYKKVYEVLARYNGY